MQSLAVNGYAAADVLYALRGVRGRREWTFRYELLSSTNVKVRDLTNVAAGSVEHNALAEIKRTAKFVIRDNGDINFLSERIKPWARIRMHDGGWAEWPLGVFLLTTPEREVDIAGVNSREIEAYDQTIVVQEDTTTDRYFISANALIHEAIVELLMNTLGINSWNVIPSTARLPVGLDWDPGTPKYTIINDLCALMNYNSIWFNGNGVAQVTPYALPSARPSEFDYLTNDVSVILPDATQTLDLYKQPNRWVLIVSEADRPPLRSEVSNTSITSPTSIPNRGRTITSVTTDEVAVSQAVLDAKAQRVKEEAAMVFEEIGFESGLMPFHDHLDIYNFWYNDMVVTGKFVEVRWAFDLQQGAKMKHTIRRTVTV